MKFKALRHFHTVNKHRWLVFIYSFKVGIPFRGLVHDLSKYGPEEFISSARNFKGTITPIVQERKEHQGYSFISTHHTNHNKHHYEYWIDFYQGDLLVHIIPYKYSLETVIDMISASKVYNKNNFSNVFPLQFFESKEKAYFMHPLNKEFLRILFTRFSEQGFKGLKKKDTKRIYNELCEKYKEHETLVVKIYSLKNSIKYEPFIYPPK